MYYHIEIRIPHVLWRDPPQSCSVFLEGGGPWRTSCKARRCHQSVEVPGGTGKVGDSGVWSKGPSLLLGFLVTSGLPSVPLRAWSEREGLMRWGDLGAQDLEPRNQGPQSVTGVPHFVHVCLCVLGGGGQQDQEPGSCQAPK